MTEGSSRSTATRNGITGGDDSNDPLLAVSDLAVDLGGRRVLEGIDAVADSGTFVGLVGPNGAGKTTLLRATNATLTPSRGTVHVAGEDVHALSSKAASRLVATVSQDTSLSFDFDVRETVRMGRTPYTSRFGRRDEADERIVEEAMSRTNVAALADRSITAISGGERQRVLLARALAQDTPLLLLDEPTASLDINHQIRTLELVRTLVDDGKTVVAAIHDLNLAAHYCDRLLLLGAGASGSEPDAPSAEPSRVLAAGSPETVLTEGALERAFGANAVVSRHPVTGSVYVTALPERSTQRAGRVHVVGGGGSASRHLYLLSAAGYDVSVGALNESDSDTQTARQLGLDVVTVDPYAPVDRATADRVRERVEAADVTLVTDIEIGEGNLLNLDAARGSDALVLVEGRPIDERNYAGEEGKRQYEALRRSGIVVGTDDVLRAVADAVDGD